jgi:hypothetical protein
MRSDTNPLVGKLGPVVLAASLEVDAWAPTMLDRVAPEILNLWPGGFGAELFGIAATHPGGFLVVMTAQASG